MSVKDPVNEKLPTAIGSLQLFNEVDPALAEWAAQLKRLPKPPSPMLDTLLQAAARFEPGLRIYDAASDTCGVFDRVLGFIPPSKDRSATEKGIRYALDKLGRNGRAVLIVCGSFDFSRKGEDVAIRKRLLDSGCLSVVTDIPGPLWSGIPYHKTLYVFDKTPGQSGAIMAGLSPVLDDETNPVPFAEQHGLLDIMLDVLKGNYQSLHAVQQSPTLAEALRACCRRVPASEIAAHEFSLAPRRYLEGVTGFDEIAERAMAGKGEVVRLGSMATVYGGKAIAKDDLHDYCGKKNEVAYLQLRDMSADGTVAFSRAAGRELKPAEEKCLLQKNDVLVSSSFNKIGVFHKDHQRVFPSANLRVVRITSDSVLPEYLRWFMLSKEAFWQLGQCIAPHVSVTRLKDFQIPLPPLSIQQAVVDALEKPDSGWDGDILKTIARISGGKVKGFDYL